MFFRILLILTLSCAGVAHAAQPMVHGVQLPAWVERDGRLLALRPSTELLPGDVIHTGARGRVELDLPEGSVARLGSGARLALPVSRMMNDAQGEFWDSTLHLLKGAFRYTTRVAGKGRRRDLRLRVGVVTIGVRGTDFWVRADAAGDEVMLMEGRISLEMQGQAMMMMEQPMDAMKFMPDGRMESMAMTSMAPELMHSKMDAMLAMTTMEDGMGMLMMDMPAMFDVVLMSLTDPGNADRAAADLGARGYPVGLEPASVDGRRFTRVVVAGFPSRAEALGFRTRVAAELGITDAWLKRSAP